MTCYCCGQQYEPRQWRCCAPPHGMASSAWAAKHCAVCRDRPGHRRCPTHCACPKPATVAPEAVRRFVESVVRAAPAQQADLLTKAVSRIAAKHEMPRAKEWQERYDE